MARKRQTDQLRRLIEAATELGFSCDYSSNRHLRFERPGCAPVFASRTPSCPRAWLNAVRDLKHALTQRTTQ